MCTCVWKVDVHENLCPEGRCLPGKGRPVLPSLYHDGETGCHRYPILPENSSNLNNKFFFFIYSQLLYTKKIHNGLFFFFFFFFFFYKKTQDY
jgi:hypothetical protein